MIAFSVFDRSCKWALVRTIIMCHSCVQILHVRQERKCLNKPLILSAISTHPVRKCSKGYFHTCMCERHAGLLVQYLAFPLLMFNLSFAFTWHETASASILRLPISGRLSDRHRTAHPLCKPFLYHTTKLEWLLLHVAAAATACFYTNEKVRTPVQKFTFWMRAGTT